MQRSGVRSSSSPPKHKVLTALGWDFFRLGLDRIQGAGVPKISHNQAVIGDIGLAVVVKVVPAGLRYAGVQVPLAELGPEIQVSLIHHAIPIAVAGAVNRVVLVVICGDLLAPVPFSLQPAIRLLKDRKSTRLHPST